MFLLLFILAIQGCMTNPTFHYQLTTTLNDSVRTINHLALSADNAILVAGNQDSNIYIYKVNDSTISHAQTLQNQGAVSDIEITYDHEWIASGTKNGVLQLYQHHNGSYALQQTIQYHGQDPQFSSTTCDFSQNGTTLIVGSDLYTYIYQRVEGLYLQLQRLRVGFVQSQLAISHDHIYIYQAQLTQHLKTLIWNNNTLQYQRHSRFYYQNRTIHSDKKISLNSDSTVLALASQSEKLLYLIDVSVAVEPKLISLIEYQYSLTDVIFSEDLLVSSSADSIQVYSFNGTNFSLVSNISDNLSTHSIVISSDSKYIYVGGQGQIYLYTADDSPDEVKTVEQDNNQEQQEQQQQGVDLILLYVSLVPISLLLGVGLLRIYCQYQQRKEQRRVRFESNKILNDRND